jgi:hypothetical protein
MERLIQWLDNVDDLISMIGLVSERIRKVLFTLIFICVALAFQVGGVLLALSYPPLASAMVILLFATLLYRQVTGPKPPFSQALS